LVVAKTNSMRYLPDHYFNSFMIHKA